MLGRRERTIRKSVEVCGVGFLTGRDVTLRFLPAATSHGIQFQRTDRPGSAPVPARIDYAVPRERRTAIEHDGTSIEMIEHVMAAVAGLQIDNCLVQLDAPEPPGMDGSSLAFAEALLDAGAVQQASWRRWLTSGPASVAIEQGRDRSDISYRPVSRPTLAISYHLDYGPRSPIRAQELTVEITPESFLQELAFCRTFVLEREARELRAAGYGARTSAKDLLVIGSEGPIENTLRADDEFARHKILDCLGDFALLGCDIHGHFCAYRSGHHLNREMVRKLLASAAEEFGGSGRVAA
ncbi:MAG TPA: UDP-3-O-acyl-N-acetylglucosamine deacetylase [Planctomycetaceae bacterium]|nr:UDP-3-O-acyl-N-acetylglucosamine deacetylase [Planctomycetaceae bacterium]